MRDEDRAQIAKSIVPLQGSAVDFDDLLNRLGDARIVLLGQTSHGSHELYSERARLTERLIRERGFCAVAVEADWPDAFNIHRYIHGSGDANNPWHALRSFKCFPTWLWRNRPVFDFIRWLRTYNDGLAGQNKVGIYGLDLYSLHASSDAVIRYLEGVDPRAAARARERYSCFYHFGEPQQYGRAWHFGLAASCAREVVEQLTELQKNAASYTEQNGTAAKDAFFHAEQNARVAKNAEEYYRTLFAGRVSSWNLRERHMMETLEALIAYQADLEKGELPQLVVWAHSSHLGDARATDMSRWGQLNLGQLARQKYGEQVFSVGLSTYQGTVAAASGWDEPLERMHLRPASPDSHEAFLHSLGQPRFGLYLKEPSVAAALFEPRPQRAIGVIYDPASERDSCYLRTHLPQQFDYLLHYDATHAVQALERAVTPDAAEWPETFPSSL